jgi:hypothetical protein
MAKKLLFIIYFSVLLLNISGCSFKEKPSNESNTEANPAQNNESVLSEDEPQSVGFNPDDYNLLESNGDTQYAWKFVGDNCVLYSLDRLSSNIKQIATFLPSGGENGTSIMQNNIVDFGICGDWIIASVGHYEGSGNYFNGDFVRLKKDGGELTHFWLTDDDTFIIVEDWIYYNFWTNKDEAENVNGCYRIRPDGSDKQYLGNVIENIYLYAEDGFVYGSRATDEMINGFNPVIDLIRCRPDTSSVITLFKGNSLPKFDNSDFIKYNDIRIENNYIFFTVTVHGYTNGDSWRGHDIYTASYRVDPNGDYLELLKEEYF